MIRIHPQSTLADQIKKAIRQATTPGLSIDHARRISRGQEILGGESLNTDDSTIYEWTVERIVRDLGTYIAPTYDLFVDTISTYDLVPFRHAYQGIGGDIRRSHGTVATPGLFLMYTAKFTVSTPRTLHLGIRTTASIWIGIDNVTVISSDQLGPNQHTDMTTTVAAGEHTIRFGVYIRTGAFDYALTGGLAGQVDKMYPSSDVDPPAAPTGFTVTTGTMIDDSNKSFCQLAWTLNTDPDLEGYYLYRKASAGADYEAIAKSTNIPGISATGYRDVAVQTGTQYWYGIRAIDRSGNVSAMTQYASNPITAGDTTPPADIASLYVNGAPQSLNSSITAATSTLLIQWENPADTDFFKTRISINNDNESGSAATAWGGGAAVWQLDEFAGDPSSFPSVSYTSQVAAEGDNWIVWFFFQTIDRAGNVVATNPPKYLKVTFTGAADPPQLDKYGLIINASAAANALGWRKTNFTLSFTDVDPPGVVVAEAQVYGALNGADFAALGGPSSTVTISTEAADARYSAYMVGTHGVSGLTVRSDITVIRYNLDKTAPSAASSVVITQLPEGLRISWTEGTDALSGLQETYVYRNTTNNSGTAVIVGKVRAGVTQWTDLQAETDKTYYYWLKHSDNADNLSAFSSVASARRIHPGVFSALNWLDNGSFERIDPSGVYECDSWQDGSGAGLDTTIGYHGTNSYALLSPNQWVKQVGVPCIARYFFLSLYAYRVSGGAATWQVKLEFKGLAGTVLTTHTISLNDVPGDATWARYTTQKTTGSKLVFGHTGDPSPFDYNPDAITIDITIENTNATNFRVDAVMLQEVVTPDAGTTWNSVETGEVAPTTFYDSRVLNVDRINAWVARFALLYANNIIAGKLASVDGKTFFDLDASEIQLDHLDSKTRSEFTATGLRKTTDTGTSWWNYLACKRFVVGGYSTTATTGTFSVTVATGQVGTFDMKDFFIVAAFILVPDDTGASVAYPLNQYNANELYSNIKLKVSTVLPNYYLSCIGDWNISTMPISNGTREIVFIIGHFPFVSNE